MVNLVVILSPATLGSWSAVVADELLGAGKAVIVTSGLVDGACFVGYLVMVHPLESIVSFSSVATIISRARYKYLWGNVDIWPGRFPSYLDSI